jgi:hypothetical protein
MGHIGTAAFLERARAIEPAGVQPQAHNRSVLVVRGDGVNADLLDTVCEFLEIGVEYITGKDDLGPMLRALRPMAIVADLAGDTQDGFHVMMIAAGYDPAVPVLLLTDRENGLLGAVDAIQEVWGLKRVVTMRDTDDIGELVDFLCHAARDGGMSRMMRV